MLMSSPSQPPAGRMSQMLPSVKCSNCNLPVPLAELGEHICAPAPPLPTLNIPKNSVNSLPRPSLSPGAAASLLPQRLQGLVTPASSAARTPTSPNPSAARNDRPRLNTNGPSYTSRSSPLSRTSEDTFAPRSTSRDPYASGGESPVRSRQPVGGFARARSGSNASSTRSANARPTYGAARDVPPAAAPPPPSVPSTQIGGEAGMAGVGRRGFAAAARAAMFATSPAPVSPPTKASPPRRIDIGAPRYGSNTTPPLSTSTGSPEISPFPESPVSPQPFNSRSRSPPSRAPKVQPKAQLQPSVSLSSRGSSKHPSSESEYSGLAYADETDYEDEDDAADLRRANEMRGGLESFRTKSPPPPLALKSDSGPSSKRFDPPKPTRGDERSRKASYSGESGGSDYGGGSGVKRNNSTRIAQAFGLSQTPPSAYGRLGGPGLGTPARGHSRASSSGSAQSAYSSKSPVARGDATATPSGSRSGAGKLERQMDSMADDARRPALSTSKSTGRQRSFSPEAKRKDLTRDMDDSASTRSRSRRNSPDRTLKPARTSPTRERSTTRDDSKRERERAVRKPKVCIRCEKKIDDGKWVQVDGGGVLCEKCWKNMYLPKCRRCNLPIERQAVSSSDGQLKGKYHRECFNCFTCHKPFPDKTFYVLDGKPLCAYHYHEANDSLCSAALCGQPIEGPCAVSHAGDRYHPEHMLCEFPGHGGCKERLDEYWEIDGRMLCERHSRATRLADEEADEDPGEWAPRKNTRAMKRVTRYIDLANGGGGRR